MSAKKSSEAEVIFDKILNGDFIISNASVSLLQEFIKSWTSAAIREDVNYKFLQNWFQKVHLLQQQNTLNDATCIASIFILDVCLKSVDVDQDSKFHFLFSQIFISFHKLIVSTCMTSINEVKSTNDAVIAFFRLHCCLSRKVKGLELIRKYNLWKQLLSFYFMNNKFNLFIQNSCTEYIDNLISVELPSELISFLEVLNASIECIKNAIENPTVQCDGVLFRSLRILYLIFSNHLLNFNENSLRITSKQCLSLESYVRHLLATSKDEIIVSYSLKLFVLLRVFLFDAQNVKNDDEIFQRFIAVTYELLKENAKFNPYMSEMFNIEIADEKTFSKLQAFSAYLQMSTIADYLAQLDVKSADVTKQVDSLAPESENIINFCLLYRMQLLAQNRIATISTNILKNVHNKKGILNPAALVYSIRLYSIILKLLSSDTRKLSEELNNVLLNVIHALSVLVSMEEDFSENQKMLTEVLNSSLIIVQADFQHSLIIRLSAFKLCHVILKKIERPSSDDDIDLLRTVIIQRLHDTCWEVRDSALEVLNEIIKNPNSTGVADFINEDICKSLLSKLVDEESFVRATAYALLTTSISSGIIKRWETHFNCVKLLDEIARRFKFETEGNVRENMIEFIIQAWRAFKIPDDLLVTIYEIIYQASTNDLHSYVRRSGMLFWKSLVEMVKCDDASLIKGENIVQYLEKLSYSGCLQAVMNGIEDEYDKEVADIALETLQILKSIDWTSLEFSELMNKDSELTIDEHLINKLPCIRLANTNFLSTKQFVSTFIVTRSNHASQTPEGNIFDFSDLLKCFADVNLECDGINQKDCY